MTSKQIFDGQAANGNSLEFVTNGTPIFKVSGTFDGCTLQLQIKTNNSADAFSNTGDAITDIGSFSVPYAPSCRYRFVLSSAGASTDVDGFVS